MPDDEPAHERHKSKFKKLFRPKHLRATILASILGHTSEREQNLAGVIHNDMIAGEVFPTKIRGSGAGFAASFAKVGAVATAFLFPIILSEIGIGSLLCFLVGASLLGALVTWRFGIETMGGSLENVGHAKSRSHEAPVHPAIHPPAAL